MNRRRFLKQMELLSGSVLCGALPAALSGCSARGAPYLTPDVVGTRVIVPRASVTERSGALVEIPGDDLPIYLRRHGPDQFSAVSTRCMHRGCQVEPAADRLACPCHGSEYTFTGEVLRGPTELPLVQYRVSSDAANIYIHLLPAGDS